MKNVNMKIIITCDLYYHEYSEHFFNGRMVPMAENILCLTNKTISRSDDVTMDNCVMFGKKNINFWNRGVNVLDRGDA